MTTQTLVLPYLRQSPRHIPRRDLVLAGSDSLTLAVSVVESDHPWSRSLELSSGLGGPGLTMVAWRDAPGCLEDYGWPTPASGDVIWTGAGTVSTDTIGTFDIFIPEGVLLDWPLRCGWAIRLDFAGTRSVMLATGFLHVQWSRQRAQYPYDGLALLTDDYIPVLEDDLDPVEV